MALPDSAQTYQQTTSRELRNSLHDVQAQWSRMGLDFDAGWTRVGPGIVNTVSRSQGRLAGDAAAFIPEVLEETGADPTLTGRIVPEAFAGMNGDGRTLAEAFDFSRVIAKQGVSQGMAPSLALDKAGRWLTMTASTALSDAKRSAEQTAPAVSQARWYVRMAPPPACGRCIVLAGQRYRWNADFNRHPRCDCSAIPATENTAGDMTTDPYEAFNALSPADQDKFFAKADAEAIRRGADMFQVVNARRGMTPSGRFTREGTSKRGYFRTQAEAGGGKYGRTRRLSVPEIMRRSGGDTETYTTLLERYGYITGSGQNPDGVIRYGR